MPKVVGTLLGCKRLEGLADELMSLSNASTVRVAPLRSAAFSLEKACSIGLRSGE
jgi:hypothetical protein